MGQEIGVSPIQMSSLISTFANDGLWVAPRIVAGTAPPESRLRTVAFHPAEPRRVISTYTAAQMRAMMERQIGKLLRLIDDLLDVSRIDRGLEALSRPTIDRPARRSDGPRERRHREETRTEHANDPPHDERPPHRGWDGDLGPPPRTDAMPPPSKHMRGGGTRVEEELQPRGWSEPACRGSDRQGADQHPSVGALLRDEFRGSHYKPEFTLPRPSTKSPKDDPAFMERWKANTERWRKTTMARFTENGPEITYRDVPTPVLAPEPRHYD